MPARRRLAATAGYLAGLEPAVLEAPDQWRGWKYLEFASAPPGRKAGFFGATAAL